MAPRTSAASAMQEKNEFHVEVGKVPLVQFNPSCTIKIDSIDRVPSIKHRQEIADDHDEGEFLSRRRVQEKTPNIDTTHVRYVLVVEDSDNKEASRIYIPEDEGTLFIFAMLELQVPANIRQQVFVEIMGEVYRLSDLDRKKNFLAEYAKFLGQEEKRIQELMKIKEIEKMEAEFEKENGKNWIVDQYGKKYDKEEAEMVEKMLNERVLTPAQPHDQAPQPQG